MVDASAGSTRAISHNVQCMREVRLNTPVAEVGTSFLDALDFSGDTPTFAFLSKATAHDIDHGFVEASIEGSTFAQVFFITTLETTVGVEVAAQLEQQVEGKFGTRRKGSKTADVGQEFEHTGAEGGSRQ